MNRAVITLWILDNTCWFGLGVVVGALLSGGCV